MWTVCSLIQINAFLTVHSESGLFRMSLLLLCLYLHFIRYYVGTHPLHLYLPRIQGASLLHFCSVNVKTKWKFWNRYFSPSILRFLTTATFSSLHYGIWNVSTRGAAVGDEIVITEKIIIESESVNKFGIHSKVSFITRNQIHLIYPLWLKMIHFHCTCALFSFQIA